MDPLDNKVLSMQSSNRVITREISRNNSKFKVMFKEKVYRYSISMMDINFVDMGVRYLHIIIAVSALELFVHDQKYV